MSVNKRKRVVVGAIAAAVLVAGGVGGVMYTHGTPSTKAAGSFISHPITVHPIYRKVSNPTDKVFGCQLTTPAVCYGPKQIRAAYNITPLLNAGDDGTGRTIVIIDAFQSPTIQSDLATFDSTFGLPDPTLHIIAPDGLTPFDYNNADMVGWAGEITLDVEWSHAVAPGATIDLVLSKSDQDADILSATRYVVDNSLGDVVSQSFGEGETCVDPNLLKAQHAVFQEATAKGITLFASAGDDGAAQVSQPPACGGDAPAFLSASSPASDPLVTGVGGTTLDADGLTGAYHSETVWNGEFGSGGGGFSTIYPRPAYQAPFGVPNGSRGVPDVSYDAAVFGGVLAFYSPAGPGSGGFYLFGGTSAGSPQWAGITAIADQVAGHRLGFLNDALYHIGKKSTQQSDFHDITSGNNTFAGITGYTAAPGWDAASGLGTPNVAALVPDLVNTHVGNDGSNL